VPSSDRALVYVLGTFPQASQTFIAREIRGLLRAGVRPRVFALRRRRAEELEGEDLAWVANVCFVPSALTPQVIASNLRLLKRNPSAYARAARSLIGLPHRPRLLRARAVWLLLKAGWIAREIQASGGCDLVHAHFALAQTEVAMAVSALLGCPFSFTAHARDIYATPSALLEKIERARLVVTCTAYNAGYLRGLRPDLPTDRIQLVHHGVEIADGPPEPRRNRAAPLLLAAGRLVDKKGFDVLIAACARLRDRGCAFRCEIVGAGPLASRLGRRVREARLEDRVSMSGWISTADLTARLADALALVVPSRVTASGDRDGIPNVVLEAMAAARPVVATEVSGIPEAVTDGVTGLLVPPDDADALAGALQRLLEDGALARRLGRAARDAAAERFDLAGNSIRLLRAFDRALGLTAPSAP
jgi:glycosyltransferase involved in cell wall biosynthesis